MNNIVGYAVWAIIPVIILFHLYYAPYTKVEESFNIQAVHDILVHGVPFRERSERLAADYDHTSFPGSVPRTFVGAIALSELSRPFATLLPNTEHQQYLVRGVLGLCNGLALLLFKDAIDQAFGRVAGYWYILLQASQFHIMYYASRTLPNMFAFFLTTISLRYIMMSNFGPRQRRTKRCKVCLHLLTFAGVIFRSEIAILLATHTASFVVFRGTSIRQVILPTAMLAVTVALLVTVSIDSFFWQKFPLWPEWVGFRFNTLQGKASEWGTSPFYFYFANSLPRLLLNPMALFVCVPLAVINQPTRKFSLELLGPLLAYIAVYSILPHKEWRFIIYTIPGITAVASAGASWIWLRRRKTFVNRICSLVLVASVVVSFMASIGLLVISTWNYPGAHALGKLHALAHGSKGLISVHLDNLSCQTGVTRFLEKPLSSSLLDRDAKSTWLYDKTDDKERLLDPLYWERFDYAIAEDPERVLGLWEVVDIIHGFTGVELIQYSASDRREGLLGRNHQNSSGEPTEVHDLFEKWEQWVRARFTKGYWPTMKMEPKLYILKRQPA